MNDRWFVFLALLAVLGSMMLLAICKGCNASDPIMLQFGTIATGLAGALAGISRGSHADSADAPKQ